MRICPPYLRRIRRFRTARLSETPECFRYMGSHISAEGITRDMGTGRFEKTRECFADDGAHEVPDMHLLERIRISVLEDDAFIRVLGPPPPRFALGSGPCDIARYRSRRERYIHESSACDFDACGVFAKRAADGFRDAVRDVAGILAKLFRRRKCHIHGIIAVRHIGGPLHYEIDAPRSSFFERRLNGLPYPFFHHQNECSITYDADGTGKFLQNSRTSVRILFSSAFFAIPLLKSWRYAARALESVGRRYSVTSRTTRAMNCPTFRISLSFMPRVVRAGVPTRTPLG